MKSFAIKSTTLILCLCILLSLMVVPVYAAPTADDIRNEINAIQQQINENNKELNDLKKDKADQQEILSKQEKQLSLLQSQIDICNSKIREYNSIIAQNEAEIAENRAAIEQTIYEFKKRIRAIYMSGGTGTGIEILMGADNFDDFVALSELTKNVSRRDRKIINDITKAMEKINEQILENEALIDSQKAIKAELDAKYSEYDSQADKVRSTISSINKSQNALNTENKNYADDIKAKEEELYSILNPTSGYGGPFDGTFTWPVPGYLGVTSEWGSRWGTHHKGIDLASSGIKGAAIVASASGKVVKVYNSCPHNWGKKSSCYSGGVRCGGGYGNYVVIAHGKNGSTYYQTLYGHMSSATVSVGQSVQKGQVIGYVGSTGWSTGWHLHFEVQTASKETGPFTDENPRNYINKSK